MDEMKLKLSTRFMRNLVAKLLTKMIQKKIGYTVNIQLNELDVSVIDGETKIRTNIEVSCNSNEFMKIMNRIGDEIESD